MRYEGHSPSSIVNQTITVEDTNFTLQFVTDDSDRFRGFKLVYKTFKGGYNIDTAMPKHLWATNAIL